MIVDGPLEKQGDGDKQSHDADAAEELRADAVFQRRCRFEGVFGDVGRGVSVWSEGRPGWWRRGRLPGFQRRLGTELRKLPLEDFDTGGESCKLCGDLTFLIAVRGLFVRAHGNYCTAITGGVVLRPIN